MDYSDSENDEPEAPKSYTIVETSRKVATKYGMEEIGYDVQFSNEKLLDKKLVDISDELRDMFNDVLNTAGRNYDADDRIRLSIMQDALDIPIIIHLAPRNQVTADTILDRWVLIYLFIYCLK